MIEIWLILALSAVVMYGVSQAAIKVALREISAPTFILATVFMTFPTYLVILIGSIAVGRYGNIDFEHFIYLILAAAFGQIGYYVYLEAAESGPISIVGSITAAYPIMVIMFAIVFLAEILTAIQAVGVGMITIGMIVLSYFHGSSENKSHLSRKCFTLCIITLLLWGFWAIFTKLSLEQVDPIFFLGFYVFIIPPVTIIYFKRNRISPKKIWPKWTVPVIIAITSSIIGNIAFFFEIHAVSDGPASIVFPLVASSPVIVVLLAFVFLKERLLKIETLLILAVIIGIILISTV